MSNVAPVRVRRLGCVMLLVACAAAVVAAQPRTDTFVAALRPALPYPQAAPDGDIPADHSPESPWFVIWPDASTGGPITVKANPLNPEMQRAAAAGMERINRAVAAAERRAQAAYEKAVEEVRRTGRTTEVEGISLDDEGVEGDRLDAELELVIDLVPAASFEVASGRAPEVTAGEGGAAWVVSVPAHVYAASAAPDRHDAFRPAEARVYFGPVQRPAVAPRGGAAFAVTIDAGAGAFAVAMRGNPELIAQVLAKADWSRLAAR